MLNVLTIMNLLATVDIDIIQLFSMTCTGFRDYIKNNLKSELFICVILNQKLVDNSSDWNNCVRINDKFIDIKLPPYMIDMYPNQLIDIYQNLDEKYVHKMYNVLLEKLLNLRDKYDIIIHKDEFYFGSGCDSTTFHTSEKVTHGTGTTNPIIYSNEYSVYDHEQCQYYTKCEHLIIDENGPDYYQCDVCNEFEKTLYLLVLANFILQVKIKEREISEAEKSGDYGDGSCLFINMDFDFMKNILGRLNSTIKYQLINFYEIYSELVLLYESNNNDHGWYVYEAICYIGPGRNCYIKSNPKFLSVQSILDEAKSRIWCKIWEKLGKDPFDFELLREDNKTTQFMEELVGYFPEPYIYSIGGNKYIGYGDMMHDMVGAQRGIVFIPILNADFDGDEMNIIIPQTEDALYELFSLYNHED